MIYVSEILYGDVDHRRAYKGSTLIAEKWIESNFVKFTANAPSTIGLNYLCYDQTLQYSLDKNSWNSLTTAVSLSLSTGDEVYVRGILTRGSTIDYTNFAISGDVTASGNINALWNYQNISAPLKVRCGYKLFESCNGLTDISRLELPATELTERCYENMFCSCDYITNTPELPAISLATKCYENMFYSCDSLVTIPNLPATTLVSRCYEGMFAYCTSLDDLSSITLSATSLAAYCYGRMFYDCRNLTAAPILPAASLVTSCYYSMFNMCWKLKYIKCLATNPSISYTSDWVYLAPSNGTFVKAASASWPTGDSGIPSGWTVQNA